MPVIAKISKKSVAIHPIFAYYIQPELLIKFKCHCEQSEAIARYIKYFTLFRSCDRHEFFQNSRDDKINDNMYFSDLAAQVIQT